MALHISDVTASQGQMRISGYLPNPSYELHGPVISTTESSIDLQYTTLSKGGVWAQNIKQVRENIDLSQFGSGPVIYRIHGDGTLLKQGHLTL